MAVLLTLSVTEDRRARFVRAPQSHPIPCGVFFLLASDPVSQPCGSIIVTLLEELSQALAGLFTHLSTVGINNNCIEFLVFV